MHVVCETAHAGTDGNLRLMDGIQRKGLRELFKNSFPKFNDKMIFCIIFVILVEQVYHSVIIAAPQMKTQYEHCRLIAHYFLFPRKNPAEKISFITKGSIFYITHV